MTPPQEYVRKMLISANIKAKHTQTGVFTYSGSLDSWQVEEGEVKKKKKCTGVNNVINDG